MMSSHLISVQMYMKVFLILCMTFCGHSIHAQRKNDFIHIDLTSSVNQGLLDKHAGDGADGWADFGIDACFKALPLGKSTLYDSIVPFHIIDPAQNNANAALVLCGPKREHAFPTSSPRIEIGRKLACLFFLHTTLYASTENEVLLQYRIRYSDDTEVLFECRNRKEIHDWWIPPARMPASIRVYEEENKWLINTPWKNPFPEKRIEWIQMESTGNAIPVLLAITASRTLNPYEQFMNLIEERYASYQKANLNIAVLQIRSNPDQDWNMKKGEEFCRIAKKLGADIVVFPEMYNLGYNGIDFNESDAMDRWKGMAVSKESEFIEHFRSLARRLEMAIVITYLEDAGEGNLPKNSASLIDMHGDIVFTYTKVHTCEFSHMENATTPGEGFFVEELNTRAGTVKIGMMICYDREAPESARILMLKGAEIILTPNACDLEALRLAQFQSRAFENAVAVVMANYGTAGDNKRFNGHSCIYNADGREVLLTGTTEGVYMGAINLIDLREIRQETIWGNAFRRPHKYKELVSPDVQDIFKRKDSFGNEFERLKR